MMTKKWTWTGHKDRTDNRWATKVQSINPETIAVKEDKGSSRNKKIK